MSEPKRHYDSLFERMLPDIGRDRGPRCAIHGSPTHPVPRCSQCDAVLPYWHELLALPVLNEGWAWNLVIETPDHRVWVARGGLEDGEPYEHTVYVERYDGATWSDLGHYDGDDPPRGLPGFTHNSIPWRTP